MKVNSYNFHSLKLIKQDLKQLLKHLKQVFSFFWQTVDIIRDAIIELDNFAMFNFLIVGIFQTKFDSYNVW